MDLQIERVQMDYCQSFLSLARQKHYLCFFANLSNESLGMLKQIYAEARDPEGGARHVLQAVHCALRDSDIFRLVRENIALRSAMAFAKGRGDREKVSRIAEMLEDFHIALDAFMENVSLAESARRRLSSEPEGAAHPCARVSPRDAETIPETFDLENMERFKEQIRPVLMKIRRHKTQVAMG